MKATALARRATRSLWAGWIRPLALPILGILAAKSALADINYVPTGSMKPTILEGDVVVVNKLAYDLKVPFTRHRLAEWSAPARGDIVVCFSPEDGVRLVKRVVALAGDTVELRDDVLVLNGTSLAYAPLAVTASGVRDLEPAELRSALFARETLGESAHSMMVLPARPARRNFGPVVVPSDHCLVLGDNRDNSRDSRYFGFMPVERIVGRAEAVFVSGDLDHWLRPRFGRFCTALE
ncbi:MAG: signal peptidase I [Opitutaceae bacterium]|nr:signal peptidase I [Opitutaceae bacterium]